MDMVRYVHYAPVHDGIAKAFIFILHIHFSANTTRCAFWSTLCKKAAEERFKNEKMSFSNFVPPSFYSTNPNSVLHCEIGKRFQFLPLFADALAQQGYYQHKIVLTSNKKRYSTAIVERLRLIRRTFAKHIFA